MTRTLLRNARYISHENGMPEVRAGNIAIDGSRIVAISDTLNGTDFDGFEPLDMSDRLVSPGLINSHTHAVLLVLRGTVEDIEGNLVYQYMVPASYLPRACRDRPTGLRRSHPVRHDHHGRSPAPCRRLCPRDD